MAFTAEPPVPASHGPHRSRASTISRSRSAGAQTTVTAGHAGSAVREQTRRYLPVPAPPTASAAGFNPVPADSTTATGPRHRRHLLRRCRAEAALPARRQPLQHRRCCRAWPAPCCSPTNAVADRSAVPQPAFRQPGRPPNPPARGSGAVQCDLGQFADHALRFLQQRGVGSRMAYAAAPLAGSLYKPVISA